MSHTEGDMSDNVSILPSRGAAAERASAGNLKRVWSNHGRRRDWFSAAQAEGREILRHAVEVKNVWTPYGE